MPVDAGNGKASEAQRRLQPGPEPSDVTRLAIIGSCISRDIWRIVGRDASDLLYISRTSLPSLVSARPEGLVLPEVAPEGLRPNPWRALVADLTKQALNALMAHRPDRIIFDFIDERFDLLSIGGTLVTRSWELETSGLDQQAALRGGRTIPRLSMACDVLWQAALNDLAVILSSSPLAGAELILHEAQWAGHYRTSTQEILPLEDGSLSLGGKPASRAAHNQCLIRYQAAFMAQFPKAHRIAAPEALRLADSGHQWGLSPFHYVDDYYYALDDQIQALL